MVQFRKRLYGYSHYRLVTDIPATTGTNFGEFYSIDWWLYMRLIEPMYIYVWWLFSQAMRLCLTRIQGPPREFIVSCWCCSGSSGGKRCMNQGGAHNLTLVSLLRYTISAFPRLRFTSIVRGIMAAEDEEVRSMGFFLRSIDFTRPNEIKASIVL